MSPPRWSRRRVLAAGAALSLPALAGCLGFVGPSVSETRTDSFAVDGFEAVEVLNRNGDVTVESGDGEGVELRAVKRGRTRSALDRVEVTDSVADGVLTLESVYGNDLSDVAVRLTVSLPETVTLRAARTGNGDVTAREVTGDATVSTSNGDAMATDVDGFVTVESANGDAVARGTTGVLGGRTANGDVDAEVFAIRNEAAFTNANGDVEVGVGPDLHADVSLAVGNGDIELDADLDVRERSENRVVGRLGDGGPRLRASAGNGDVRLYEL
jgi:hypothetical protein